MIKKEVELAVAGVAQLVGLLSRTLKGAGSIPGQGRCGRQLIHVSLSN